MTINPGRQASETAFVALGSNLSHPISIIQQAIKRISMQPNIELKASSSMYKTAPVGYLDQDDFINAVIQIETSLNALDLLHELLKIELEFGRQRPFKDAPRTLDLDLLVYGQLECHSEQLILPHPRMHQRAFVMVPLEEIAPELTIAKIGKVKQITQHLVKDGIHKIEPFSSKFLDNIAHE